MRMKLLIHLLKKIGTKVIGIINRSELIQSSELEAKTVVEKYPDSVESKKLFYFSRFYLE